MFQPANFDKMRARNLILSSCDNTYHPLHTDTTFLGTTRDTDEMRPFLSSIMITFGKLYSRQAANHQGADSTTAHMLVPFKMQVPLPLTS